MSSYSIHLQKMQIANLTRQFSQPTEARKVTAHL